MKLGNPTCSVPAPSEGVLDQRFDLVLVHPGAERAHRSLLGVGGERNRLAQASELVSVLDQPERSHCGR